MTQTEEPSVVTISDTVLVRRFLAGDTASFEALFERHYDMVYGVTFRLLGNRGDAEDLAQEVFLKLYRRPLRRAENVAGWLYRVALNTAYNALKAEQRRLRRERVTALDDTEAPDPPHVEVARRETRRQVQQVLARMPRRTAQMLVLREMGFSYREIAGVVDVAPGSVGKLLERARKAFLGQYEKMQGEAMLGQEETGDVARE